MKIKQYKVFRIIKPTKLELILIQLLLPKNCINKSLYRKNVKDGIKQVSFTAKYKVHPFLNQVLIENYHFEHPSMLYVYKDMSFKTFMGALAYYISDAYIETDSEKALKKDIHLTY